MQHLFKWVHSRLMFITACLCLLAATSHADDPFPASSSFEFGSSPGGSARDTVLDAINSAKSSLRGVIYEFTDPVIEKALVDARGRGITVQIVADYQASKIRDSVVPDLVARGIDIRLDKVHAVTHHKMLIVDDRSVELGSFNWTRSAVSRNAEDDILIRNVPELARKATVVWRACWDESIEPE